MSSPSVLPPTFNALAPEQRGRLMRSTRKLGALLGTTPHLIEDAGSSSPSQSPVRRPSTSSGTAARLPIGPQQSNRMESPSPAVVSRSRRREVSIYGHSPSDSTTSRTSFELATEPPTMEKGHTRRKPSLSLASATARQKQDAPPPLFLRLQPVPGPSALAPVSPGQSTSAPATPNSATFDTPATPMTPLTPLLAPNLPPQEYRRKKMAKLARTLGENVPPSLVFGDDAQDPSFMLRRSRRRSRSVSDLSASWNAWTLPSELPKLGMGKEKEKVQPAAEPQPQPQPPLTPTPATPRATSKLQRSRSAAASKPHRRIVTQRNAAPMSWAVNTSANAPMPWADPALLAEYGKMPFIDDKKMPFVDDRKTPFVDDRKIPSLDGPVFQNGIPIVSQAPVPFPRPIGEQLAPPVDERRRREDGWSGEWNMDIDDVRRRLRGLK